MELLIAAARACDGAERRRGYEKYFKEDRARRHEAQLLQRLGAPAFRRIVRQFYGRDTRRGQTGKRPSTSPASPNTGEKERRRGRCGAFQSISSCSGHRRDVGRVSLTTARICSLFSRLPPEVKARLRVQTAVLVSDSATKPSTLCLSACTDGAEHTAAATCATASSTEDAATSLPGGHVLELSGERLLWPRDVLRPLSDSAVPLSSCTKPRPRRRWRGMWMRTEGSAACSSSLLLCARISVPPNADQSRCRCHRVRRASRSSTNTAMLSSLSLGLVPSSRFSSSSSARPALVASKLRGLPPSPPLLSSMRPARSGLLTFASRAPLRAGGPKPLSSSPPTSPSSASSSSTLLRAGFGKYEPVVAGEPGDVLRRALPREAPLRLGCGERRARRRRWRRGDGGAGEAAWCSGAVDLGGIEGKHRVGERRSENPPASPPPSPHPPLHALSTTSFSICQKQTVLPAPSQRRSTDSAHRANHTVHENAADTLDHLYRQRARWRWLPYFKKALVR